jgi:hypothetical protein
MVDQKVLVGVTKGEYDRRSDFNDYVSMLELPSNSMRMSSFDRSPAKGRNTIVEQGFVHNCTHILYIDDDQTFESKALFQLLAHNVDIVSGLYLTKTYPHIPLAFDVATENGSVLPMYLDEDAHGLKEVVATGFGFCLIKMDVFRKLEKPWVRLGELDPEEWCDDIGFFNRVRKAGIKIHCDLDCIIGHIGTMIVKPKFYNGQWNTEYDTGGKGSISTPQIIPELVK